MENVLITVIAAIYNVEAYAEKCIQSICNQTYRNLEIILVDDGSQDDSGFLCDKLACADSRIKVIHQKNGGLVKCRKAGISKANGEIIAFVDGDDYLEPEMYEKLYFYMEQFQADIVHSGYMVNGTKYLPNRMEINLNPDNRLEILNKYVFDLNNEDRIRPGIWSKLFQRELAEKCYGNVPDHCQMGEDILFLTYCMGEPIRFVSVDTAFYHYVQRQASIMNGETADYYLKKINLVICLKNILQNYGMDDFISGELDLYMKNEILSGIKKCVVDRCFIQQYVLMETDLVKNKKVVLYGAGMVGRDYYMQLKLSGVCEIVLWVDKNAARCQFDYGTVFPADKIRQTEFDLILIAVQEKKIAECVIAETEAMGVSSEKILWMKPGYACQKRITE